MQTQSVTLFDSLKDIYFSVIQLVEEKNQNVYIFGDNRSGKTTILERVKDYFQTKEEFSTLFLTGNNSQRDYNCFHSALHNIGSKINMTSELLNNVEEEKLKFPSQLASFALKFQKNKIKHNTFHLNEVENEILYRIKLLKKKKSLIIFVDNFILLDESSKKLLYFISSQKNKSILKFLKGTVIIATAKSKLELQKDGNNMDFKEIMINDELSKSEYFNIFNNINESTISELYKITNGKLGLTQDILNEVNSEDLSEILEDGMVNYKEPIFKILRKRLDEAIEQNLEIEEVLKKAAVIGDTFHYLYLFEICKQEEFQIRRTLKKAEKEAFISNIENKGYFSSEYIYHFFSSIVDEYRSEYNFEMARALKKLKSRDYYGRYHHLKLAGKDKESIAALIVYLLTSYINYDIKANQRLESEIQDSIHYREVYFPLIEALKSYKSNKSKKEVFLHCKESIIVDSSLLVVEHDYIFCYLLYKLGNKKDFLKCESILISILKSDLEIDTDQWLRVSTLLVLLYINRLDMFEKAKKVYKNISFYFVKNEKDRSIDYYFYYLKLISPALDSLNTSKIELETAITFFEQQFPRYRTEYIWGLTNLSGVYLYNSEYEEGFAKSSEALELINELSLDFEKKERILSNFLLCGLYSKQLCIGEVVEQYKQILSTANRSSDTLFKNNYLVLKAILGDISNVFPDMLDLYEKEKRDYYYSFLLGSNLIVLAIVNNEIELATEVFEDIKEIIPAISNYEKYEIRLRFDVIDRILSSLNPLTLTQIEEIFEEQLPSNIGSYWKQSLLVTDFQYWS